jgi:hypothetical protein
LQEQARAMRELTISSTNVTEQIKLISDANLRHSELADLFDTGDVKFTAHSRTADVSSPKPAKKKRGSSNGLAPDQANLG